MEWSIQNSIKEKGEKYGFVRREWVNSRDYIDRYKYRFSVRFVLESEVDFIYLRIKMKKKKKVENNGFRETEDFVYKITVDKNTVVLTKNNINENYFWDLLLRGSLADFEYIKKYIAKIASNSFFEKEIYPWLNNSSLNLV